MAIKDMKGTVIKDKATMTGMMNTSTKKIDPPNLSGMKKLFDKPKQEAKPLVEQSTPRELGLAERVQNLSDEEKALLTQVLSPSVKNVLGKVAPELNLLLDAAPASEENMIIPLSVAKNFASKTYRGLDEDAAISNFISDLQNSVTGIDNMMDNQTVPPGTQISEVDDPAIEAEIERIDSGLV